MRFKITEIRNPEILSCVIFPEDKVKLFQHKKQPKHGITEYKPIYFLL